MSQYPSPYSPPNVMPSYGAPYGVPPDALRSAKRASILMFILGGLVALLGACNSFSVIGMPADQYVRQAQQMQGTQQPLPMTAEQFKTLTLVFAVALFVGGLVFIGLAVGVRRGGKVSTFLATGLTAVLLAGGVLTILLCLIASLQSPVVLGVACMLIVPLGLMVWLMFLLIGSLRILPHMNAVQQQYQAQYWQYQQNMHAYMGYGQPQQMPQQPPSMGYQSPGYIQSPQAPIQPPTPPQPDADSPPPQA